MDFGLEEGVEGFREEVRVFMVEHLTPEVRWRTYSSGTMHDWEFHHALGEKGWIALSWPVEYGGGGRSPMESAIFFEEANYAGAPLYGMNTTTGSARAVLHCGSDELKQKVIPEVLAGRIIIALGLSEPDSGSDVAAAKTAAVQDGSVWVINGQKVFTSTVEECAYIFLLTRTDPDVDDHQGLTVFLVPTDTPGIEVTPIYTLGERTNMTYYSDVVVEDRWRVGEVNQGWEVLTTALAFERGGHGFHGHMMSILDQTLDHFSRPEVADRAPARLATEIGRFSADVEVARLLDHRTAWIHSQNRRPGVEGSMAKLFASEHYTSYCATLLDLMGPDGLLQPGEADAPGGGWMEFAHRYATPTTVYGGASEVQRSIVAERGLALPRSR